MAGDFSKEEKDGLYKAIYTRRDVRSHFTKSPIKDETLVRILHAAHHAPSVGFSQPWSFVLVRDAKTRQKIKESFETEREKSLRMLDDLANKTKVGKDKDDLTGRKAKYASLKLEGITESALNVCVTYDPARFGPFVIGRTSIPEAGLYSVCCAVQNLWLAARTEGIGVGWVSILSNDVLRDVLHIPKTVMPVAYLCVGHVDEFAPKPDLADAGWLQRLNLADVTCFERWNSTDAKRSDIPSYWSDAADLIRGMNIAHKS